MRFQWSDHIEEGKARARGPHRVFVRHLVLRSFARSELYTFTGTSCFANFISDTPFMSEEWRGGNCVVVGRPRAGGAHRVCVRHLQWYLADKK